MKLFISQPMNGKTDAEIHCERSRIIGEAEEDPQRLKRGVALFWFHGTQRKPWTWWTTWATAKKAEENPLGKTRENTGTEEWE